MSDEARNEEAPEGDEQASSAQSPSTNVGPGPQAQSGGEAGIEHIPGDEQRKAAEDQQEQARVEADKESDVVAEGDEDDEE